ncbi:hypothetical protein J4526_05660 [Desulfurococcaceae archaeon MEX13E-LK6-19]|nr:hypothetical protein J4526_05660 [Desulfurococcaceae archaeon MEX13E-LK6-19]
MKLTLSIVSKIFTILFLVSCFLSTNNSINLVLSVIFLIILFNTYIIGYHKKLELNPPLWVIPLSYTIYYALILVTNNTGLISITVLSALLFTVMVRPDDNVMRKLSIQSRIILAIMLVELFLVALLGLQFYTFFLLGPVLEAMWVNIFCGRSVLDKLLGVAIIALYYSIYPVFIPYVFVVSVIKLMMFHRGYYIQPVIADYITRVVYGWVISLGY